MSEDAVDLKEIYSDLALMHSRMFIKAFEGVERDDEGALPQDARRHNLSGLFHERRMIELACEIISILEREFYSGEI